MDVKALKDRIGVMSVLTELGAEPAWDGDWDNLKFFCPFCDDIGSTKPAGSADDLKGLWHCWSCLRGGDIITAVREGKGLGFNEAVQWLVETFPDEEVEFDPWRSEEEAG